MVAVCCHNADDCTGCPTGMANGIGIDGSGGGGSVGLGHVGH